jgi:hypothetical protein
LSNQNLGFNFFCGNVVLRDELIGVRTHRIFLISATLASLVAALESRAEERKTLLQWSYGTSFEGGPDLNEPIVTDRPDFTEASSTVGRGVVQIEAGYTFFHNNDAGVQTDQHSFPETLLRVGMFADWFEFRADWNYAVEDTTIAGATTQQSGAEDLTLGCKIGLTPQESILPETAIIIQFSVPTGGDAFTANEVLPGINYLYGWDINGLSR